jgi:hypothetical protein
VFAASVLADWSAMRAQFRTLVVLID